MKKVSIILLLMLFSATLLANGGKAISVTVINETIFLIKEISFGGYIEKSFSIKRQTPAFIEPKGMSIFNVMVSDKQMASETQSDAAYLHVLTRYPCGSVMRDEEHTSLEFIDRLTTFAIPYNQLVENVIIKILGDGDLITINDQPLIITASAIRFIP